MLAGLAAVTGVHLWRRNPPVSIGGGTAVYVLLASTLPGLA